jgi:hypothetical protein
VEGKNWLSGGVGIGSRLRQRRGGRVGRGKEDDLKVRDWGGGDGEAVWASLGDVLQITFGGGGGGEEGKGDTYGRRGEGREEGREGERGGGGCRSIGVNKAGKGGGRRGDSGTLSKRVEIADRCPYGCNMWAKVPTQTYIGRQRMPAQT